jgi:hypothetical protein
MAMRAGSFCLVNIHTVEPCAQLRAMSSATIRMGFIILWLLVSILKL